MLAAGLELRLDQRDQLASSAASASGAGSNVARPIKLASQVIMSIGSGTGLASIARVRPLADDDARILAQFPGELAVPNIDGVDALGPARQQHVGKSAGRCANVEGRFATDHDPEMVESVSELEAPA